MCVPPWLPARLFHCYLAAPLPALQGQVRDALVSLFSKGLKTVLQGTSSLFGGTTALALDTSLGLLRIGTSVMAFVVNIVVGGGKWKP